MSRLDKFTLAVCIVACIAAASFLIMRAHKTTDEMLKTYKMFQDQFYSESFAVAGVAADEHMRCLRWAFGEDILSVERRLWPERWNERHSDIFTMIGSDETSESLTLVGQAYCKRPQAINIEGGAEFSIKDCNFVEEVESVEEANFHPVHFVCPKCQGTALLGKPHPIALKREVGAVAELIVDWFCNDCGYPVDSERN